MTAQRVAEVNDEFADILYDELHSDALGNGGNRKAHEGFVFQCAACGKQSRDRYGFDPISRGWDGSCVMNAQLVKV